MSYRGKIVVNWLKYADYILAWLPIPISDRPRYNITKIGDEWVAKLK